MFREAGGQNCIPLEGCLSYCAHLRTDGPALLSRDPQRFVMPLGVGSTATVLGTIADLRHQSSQDVTVAGTRSAPASQPLAFQYVQLSHEVRPGADMCLIGGQHLRQSWQIGNWVLTFSTYHGEGITPDRGPINTDQVSGPGLAL